MQTILKKYSDGGAKLIALCPQRQEFNDAVSEELSLTFPVIQDRGNQLATAFGLTLQTPPDVIEAERYLGLNLPECNDTDNWDLPMPARYVIDRSGSILFASVHADHRLRSEPEVCLEIMSDSSNHVSKTKKDSMSKLSGIADGDEGYEEILRLGKEIRDADQAEE